MTQSRSPTKPNTNKIKDLAESGVATVLSVDQWQPTPESKCDCARDEKLSVNFICMHPGDGRDNHQKSQSTKCPDLAHAARYQEIFLDMVGMLYAVQDAGSRHVLDDRFDSFLSEGEKKLKDSLLQFLNNQCEDAKQTHAFRHLEQTLQATMGYRDVIGRKTHRKAAKQVSNLWKHEQKQKNASATSAASTTFTSTSSPQRPISSPSAPQSPTTTTSSTTSPSNDNPGHVFVCNSSVSDIQCDAFLSPGCISLKKNHLMGSIFGQWFRNSRAAELMRLQKGMDQKFRKGMGHQRLGLQSHQGYGRLATFEDWPNNDEEPNLPLFVAGEVSLEAQLKAYYNSETGKRFQQHQQQDLPPDDFRIEFLLETVRQFLQLASTLVQQNGKKPNVHRERYLLALPILGTGGGFAGDMTGKIVHAILETASNFVFSVENMDVVVVTADDATYAHAQVIRNQSCKSQYPCFTKLHKSQTDYAQQLASLAAGRHLALFVGAGVSIGSGLPSWFGLLNLVEDAFTPTGDAGERTVGDDCDWDPLAMGKVLNEWCNTKSDRNGVKLSLKKRVCNHLTENGHTLGLLLALLMSLPFHSMVTQNYDTLIEQACQKWNIALRYPPTTIQKTKRHLSVIPYRPQRKSDYWLLKMHGCVSKPEEIILTQEDYAKYSTSSKSQALDGLVQASLLTKHLLFVGFSLTDPNYLRIIDQVREALYTEEEEEALESNSSSDTDDPTVDVDTTTTTTPPVQDDSKTIDNQLV